MAVTIYDAGAENLYWPYPIIGGVSSWYLNKCVDGVSGQWVYWRTQYQDFTGEEYPDSSFSAATYRVQAITFGT